MSTILVVGASGFLGQHLLAIDARQVVVGSFFSRAKSDLIFLDLRKPSAIDQVMNQIKPDVVLYAAGLTDVNRCEEAKQEAQALNRDAPGYFASFDNVRIFYFSTDYVFDGARGSYSEHEEPRPLNFYGVSKLAGEREVLKRNSGNVVIRVSGLYDSDGIKGTRFAKPGGGVHSIESDDTRFSNPVHVSDVLSATRAILKSGKGGTFHVGGPDTLSRYEFTQIVNLHVPGSPSVMPAKQVASELQACRPRNSSLCIARMSTLGWEPRRVADALHEQFGSSAGLPNDNQPGNRAPKHRLGLLIDCVGALLTKRNWLPADPTLEQIDDDCSGVVDGSSFWKHAISRLGKEPSEVGLVQEQLAARYVPNPAVWNLLREWRSLYRLALVNNGASATFRRWAEKYGLRYVFDFLANSEELGVRKPEELFFLKVANELRVPPERCLLIDDSLENVDGANRYGLTTLLTRELSQFPLSLHSCDRTEVMKQTNSMLAK